MYSSVLKIIFFSLVLYKTTEAAVSLLGPEEKPAKYADQKGCYLSILNLVLEVNVPYYPPQDGTRCEQYTCNENGQTELSTCDVQKVRRGKTRCTTFEGNNTLPYPDCCDLWICSNEDGTYSDL